MKQVVRKGQGIAKRPDINSIKASLNLTAKNDSDLSKSCAEKEITFIPMGDAFQNALQIPGVPMGYTSVCTGWSNTGKSTAKNKLIASCQQLGVLPVIFETEQNFDWKYAIDCGVKANPVYADIEYEKLDEDGNVVLDEKGRPVYETRKEIVDWEGDFLFYDQTLLARQYGNQDYSTGKETKTYRTIAVIEDIAKCMGDILDLQEKGDIKQPICFIWDSVGSVPSFKSVKSNVGNNMFDAGAISEAFNIILNNRIPSSRRIDNPYTNTLFLVNKIWNDSMNAVGGAASIELKGGKSIYYGARLIFHMGGIAKAGTKKLTATAGGQTYQYGIQSKIRVTKNQLPAPYNITYEGEVCCVHNGFVAPERLDEYKKTYAKDLLKKLEALNNGEIDDMLSFSEMDEDDAIVKKPNTIVSDSDFETI